MKTKTSPRPQVAELRGVMRPGYDTVLTDEALSFVTDLIRNFANRRDELLARRRERQTRFDAGEKPTFLPETADIRARDWTVAPIPKDLLDRRVEITGPVERKMIINALNSGSSVFMADFEDSNSPTWDNNIQGHINLKDAVRRTISFKDPETGKPYKLNDRTAVLMVRPRGLHLDEKHVWVDGRPAPGSLVDFGLYLFHNAKELLARGTGPYFYVPKLQSHLEARWWNDVFVHAQDALGIPRGSIRATVLIETLPAAFELDEILWELREHSAGLNCGRWDYLFSFIKTLRNDPAYVMPDRGQVTMEQHAMRSYTQLVIKTCHRRNIHAMGGMSAYIPVKTDPEKNAVALDQVRKDKLREVREGHDGTWVAHPGLVPVAKEIFDAHMKTPNQIHVKRDDVNPTAADLLRKPVGTSTVAGLKHNIDVGVQYLASWLRGVGCVPIYNLMEDAATAEISRTQVWQWLKHGAELDGERLTKDRFRALVADQVAAMKKALGPDKFDKGMYQQAGELFERISVADTCPDFLTLPAYEQLLALEAK